MWRWMLRVAAVFSLVLLAGSAWLWVRSWSVHDVLMRHRMWIEIQNAERHFTGEHYLWLNNSQGKATISTLYNTAPRSGGIGSVAPDTMARFGGRGSINWELIGNPLMDMRTVKGRYSKWIGLGGFGYGSKEEVKSAYPRNQVLAGGVYKTWCILFPWWAMVLIFAITPAWCVLAEQRRWRRRKRERGGLCVACGYDLRGSGEI